MPSILLLTCIAYDIKDLVTRIIEKITYSLSSPEALEEVIKLGLSCDSLDLYITNQITFIISFDEENSLSLELGLLVLPGVFTGKEEWNYEWKMPGFSIRDVLNHFTRIFSRIRIKSLQVHCERTHFDLNLVKHELRGVQFKVLVIGGPRNVGHVRAAINLLPYPDMLGFLITKPPRIWTNKELNRFLKLCIKGSMHNLENLMVTNDNGWDLTAVLKGIPTRRSPSGFFEFKMEDGGDMMVILVDMPQDITFHVWRRGSRSLIQSNIDF
uniref:FBA_2 domain-containing protein n=1 Tax=Caenorhabditis tropicalis TaxID=1561998 RepID=A0A1I7THB2_9PELO